jgi:Zn-dependent membrane protease YugP
VLIFYVIAGLTMLFAYAVKKKLMRAYRKWGGVQNAAGATGLQTAHTLLRANDLGQIHLAPAPGELSDHYDPQHQVIRLSEPVYGVSSVAAMAIAAHESGHAIQDKMGYRPFRIRTALVPLASLGSRFGMPAAVLGFLMGDQLYVQIGILTYLGALIFQIATLPVEFNASKRARQQLDELGLVSEVDKQGVREMLSAAALTYVAGVASSAGYLIFLVIFAGRWMFGRGRAVLPPM